MLETRAYISGILMTMYNPSTNLSQQVVQEVIKHFGDRVFETLIPRNVRLSEAPSYGLPVNKRSALCWNRGISVSCKRVYYAPAG